MRGGLAAAWLICQKDARIELRTREIVATAGVFAVVVGFLASMSFHVDDKTNPSVAAGTIWITIFFAAVLSFGRVWQRERDESALTALLVAPIPRASIYAGKALATFAMIAVLASPLVVLCLFLFDISLFGPAPAAASCRVIAGQCVAEASSGTDTGGPHAAAFAGFLVLGTAAVALVGTLFGAMTVRTRARDLVLAIVLFPLLSPVLVCGVVGTRNAFEHQPFDTYAGFLGLMGAQALVSLALGVGLFGALLED